MNEKSYINAYKKIIDIINSLSKIEGVRKVEYRFTIVLDQYIFVNVNIPYEDDKLHEYIIFDKIENLLNSKRITSKFWVRMRYEFLYRKNNSILITFILKPKNESKTFDIISLADNVTRLNNHSAIIFKRLEDVFTTKDSHSIAVLVKTYGSIAKLYLNDFHEVDTIESILKIFEGIKLGRKNILFIDAFGDIVFTTDYYPYVRYKPNLNKKKMKELIKKFKSNGWIKT